MDPCDNRDVRIDAQGMTLPAIADGVPVGSAAIRSVCLDNAPGDSLSGAQEDSTTACMTGGLRRYARRPLARWSAVRMPGHGFVGRDGFVPGFRNFWLSTTGVTSYSRPGRGWARRAFLADLVAREAYIHHFVRGPANTPNEEQAIRALSAQLLIAWPGCGDGDDLHTEAVRHSDYLKLLLDAAANRRDTLAPGEKIVRGGRWT